MVTWKRRQNRRKRKKEANFFIIFIIFNQKSFKAIFTKNVFWESNISNNGKSTIRLSRNATRILDYMELEKATWMSRKAMRILSDTKNRESDTDVKESNEDSQ